MIGNLFAGLPDSIPEELFETSVIGDHLRLERIISFGHATQPGQWYDQELDEWVVLLSGRAGLLFEGESEVVEMRPGDYIQIPAHRRHRVEWTAAGEKTVWLAVHYQPCNGKVGRSEAGRPTEGAGV